MIAYFDCSSGVSGDMLLGALVDAGVSIEKLKRELKRLPVDGYELKVRKVKRNGFQATKVDVRIEHRRDNPARKWGDVEKLIKSSKLSKDIKQKGLHIFKRLFEAEAMVHGGKFDKVHLHELGAVDCIVDIMGALIGFDMLGIDTIYSSSLNLGSGTVKTAHGILPVPAPATVQLLKSVSVYSSDVPFELTTPTGAVLISTLAAGFCPMPEMEITNVATGAGGRDLKDRPNVLRMIMGRGHNAECRTPNPDNGNEVTVIETNIDDMNPQVYEYVMELLFEAGALDVFMTQIIMKKGRPGVTLSVICDEDNRAALMDIMLRETTSIGLRYYSAARKTLPREIESRKTKYGPVNVKVSKLDGKGRKTSLEYEDCKKIARKFNVPLVEVMNSIKLQ